MDLTYFVVYATIIENTLACCGLARIDVRHDSDVPHRAQGHGAAGGLMGKFFLRHGMDSQLDVVMDTGER